MPVKKEKRKKPSQTNPVWLTLSNNEIEYKNRLVLTDILLGMDGKTLWIALVDAGFKLHPQLVDEYIKKELCLICGGLLNIAENEIKCISCDCIYYEQ